MYICKQLVPAQNATAAHSIDQAVLTIFITYVTVHNDKDIMKTLPVYLLTPWWRILFEKLFVTQLVKKYPAFLQNPKVHHHVHKSPPLDPILSQMNPAHPIDPYLQKVHFNVILPSRPRSSQWSRAFAVTKFDEVRSQMMTKMVLEMLVPYRHLMWLIAWEDFIKLMENNPRNSCTLLFHALHKTTTYKILWNWRHIKCFLGSNSYL
jgi:hypothetical protein